DESAIIDAINKTPGKHNIVGHSWGGAAGIDITAAVDPGKVGTLITLDAVSYGPKSDPLNYDTWINVHQVQTPIDYVGSIPVVGDLIKLLSPLDVGGAAGDSVATVGGQLGAESGAVNIPSTNGHGEAGRMLDQAESHMQQQNSTPNPNN
ncbi:MAG: hypothetical protein GY820_43515, partial [Gammaproteobacteria bacterium]|nr:hypothetical protein [Gammaproteobacteria bacterium]